MLNQNPVHCGGSGVVKAKTYCKIELGPDNNEVKDKSLNSDGSATKTRNHLAFTSNALSLGRTWQEIE